MGAISQVERPHHIVAVVGGAVAGSEAAAVLATRGVEVVVFEANDRPYGKIEDGLPRWHQNQRTAEYARIRDKLGRPGVHFVPRTRLGADISFEDLVERWGFSAVLLANGAWKDRPLPVSDPDRYIDRGLLYQNAVIHWFNHQVRPTYDGPHFEIPDGALIVGGGLASLDVVKICMIETVGRALRARGIETEGLELDKGLPRALKRVELEFDELGVEPCTLFYRRRVRDMPIAKMPSNPTPEVRIHNEGIRVRIVENFQRKFCFRFLPLRSPHSLLTEGDRCVGLRMSRTSIESGRVCAVDEPPEVFRSPLVIASIGSLPEPIEGIEMDGPYYSFENEETGRYLPVDGVFGVGNVITGRGNIRVSQNHSQHIADLVAARFDGRPPAELHGSDVAARVAEHLAARPVPSSDEFTALRNRVQARQAEVGYVDLDQWLTAVGPPC